MKAVNLTACLILVQISLDIDRIPCTAGLPALKHYLPNFSASNFDFQDCAGVSGPTLVHLSPSRKSCNQSREFLTLTSRAHLI